MKGDKLIFKIILFSLAINALVHLAIYLSTDSRFDTKEQSVVSQNESTNQSFDMDHYLSSRIYELDKKLDAANFYIIMLLSIFLSIAALKIRELSNQVRRLETKMDQVNAQLDGEPSILNKRD